ncbi:Hsp20/alpha crystallin family protein [Roseibacterium sp. SDUM158016]|uniref:Hsp20/alpha crystallin family protein n=1 Tax=Roseicyclus sediminis TaxID=2980997 RepID=UPI0021D01F9D|nr:Hsp20/alpha crystallin family protein [Roseibacterium sp. SDUM158016]MCU4653818.1 Hsp20/alpha crystallin family protein [Roseibacterium sp. SDUM158016]
MVESSHKSGLFPSLMDPLRSLGTRVADWFAPASEASVNGSNYRIALELPGVAEEDIDIRVHDGAVTVSGEKTAEREEKGETWFFSERAYGSFSRSFRLPPDADAGAIAADLKDGLLTITVPKKAEKAPEGAKKVQIRKG